MMACSSMTVATILQWFGKLDPAGSSYAMIIIGVVAGYITGNVMERNSLNRYPQGRNNDEFARDRT